MYMQVLDTTPLLHTIEIFTFPLCLPMHEISKTEEAGRVNH